MQVNDQQLIKQIAAAEDQGSAHTLPAQAYQAGIFDVLDKTYVLRRSWLLI